MIKFYSNKFEWTFLSLLFIGLIFVNVVKTAQKRRILRCKLYDDSRFINYYVRLHFEHIFLAVAKNLRRKWSERKFANKLQKMKNGNKKSRELSILSWNSGNSYLINQINEVKWLI